MIVKQGKGRIRGGRVEAGKGIEANEIGSVGGVKTLVSAGFDLKIRNRMAHVAKEVARFKRNRAKIDRVLARYAKKGQGRRLPKEVLLKLSRVIKLRREVVLEEQRLAKKRKELDRMNSQTDIHSAMIRVEKGVYPATTVVVGEYAYRVKDEIRDKVTFVSNREDEGVKIIR